MKEKSFDLMVVETKEKLREVLNKSGLTITVMELVLKELFLTVSEQANSTIANLRKQEVTNNDKADK